MEENISTQNSENETTPPVDGGNKKDNSAYWKFLAFVAVGILAFTQFFDIQIMPKSGETSQTASVASLEEMVLPKAGVVLPVRWGDLGKQMADVGVIDRAAFESLYKDRGIVPAEVEKLLASFGNETVTMTQANAGVMLNLLWAFGLGNKNEILEKGEMNDPRFGGAQNFASTGGWTIAKGSAMDHYSKHSFVALTPAQQTLVDRVSRNIYRPCCDNSTHFPDCNHGMAMLGLLELMAANGVSEKEMYSVALKVNALWFPDTYLTIAKYLETKGTSWDKADPKELLGENFSSVSGYRKIVSQVTAPVKKSAGGCGV